MGNLARWESHLHGCGIALQCLQGLYQGYLNHSVNWRLGNGSFASRAYSGSVRTKQSILREGGNHRNQTNTAQKYPV